MNTAAVIGAVASVLVAVVTLYGRWLVKRGERSDRLVDRNLDDADYHKALAGVLRVDYWGLFGWASSLRANHRAFREGSIRICESHRPQLEALAVELGDPGPMPAPAHIELDRAHAKRSPASPPDKAEAGGD